MAEPRGLDEAVIQASVAKARAAVARKRRRQPRNLWPWIAGALVLFVGGALILKESARPPVPVAAETVTTNGDVGSATAASQPRFLDIGRGRELDALPRLETAERRWADAVQLASSTSRIALAPVIGDMQAQRRDIDATPMPPCLTNAVAHFKSSMDQTLASFFAFMQEDNKLVRDALASEHAQLAADAMARYRTVKSSCTKS